MLGEKSALNLAGALTYLNDSQEIKNDQKNIVILLEDSPSLASKNFLSSVQQL